MSLLKQLRKAHDPRQEALNADPYVLRALLDEVGGGTALANEISYEGDPRRFREIDTFNEAFIEALESHTTPETAGERVWEKRARGLQAEIERLEDWRELHRETIQRCGMTFSPVKVPGLPRASNRDEHVLIQCISDVHVGEQTTLSETGGVAEYSFDIFLKRLSAFKQHFSMLTEDLRSIYPVPTLVVLVLGDIATSEGVFPKQLARNDLDLNDQVFQASQHLSELMQWFASLFNKVVVYCVPGNHTPKELTLSSDRLVYHDMQLLLQKQTNVTIHETRSHYLGFRIGPNDGYCDFGDATEETDFLITHGHQARGFAGIPYYGLDRMVRRYSEMTDHIWDYMYCGHHHQNAQAGHWRMCSCWPGGNEFSTEKMQGASRPGQLLDLFHPKEGITLSAEVHMADRPCVGDADARGIYTPTVSIGDDDV